jgi:segregation and condensation protein B
MPEATETDAVTQSQTEHRTEHQTDPRTEPDAETTPDASAGEPAGGETLSAQIEAIVLSTSKPVPAARIAEVVSAIEQVRGGEAVEAPDVDGAIARLNADYERTGRAFRIEAVAGGYRVMTRPEHAGVLAAFHRKQASSRLSRPAVETLAIIAYKQPITRAKLEAIRGVGCGEVLKSLLERRLIAVTGRAEELGRPMLYGTTKQFLDSFGIRSVKDLPSIESMVSTHGEPA